MRPAARMPKLTRRSRILIAVALAGVVLLLIGPRLIDAWVNWLWFGELGYRSVFTTVLVMGSAITAEKLKHGAPDLIVRPKVGGFRSLDFLQASAILRASEPVKAEVKEKLAALLGA